MDALKQLLSRNSHRKLVAPAPSEKQLEVLFRAALRAPDHAMLRPWRYRVFTGEGLALLGDFFAQAASKSEPDISKEKLDKVRGKPGRAPMVIVASVCLTEHPKVPRIEQILSAGASVQNLLMAAHFQNIGAIWRTGEMAFNSDLMELLKLSDDEIIVGFIYLGTEIGDKKKVKEIEINDFVTRFD